MPIMHVFDDAGRLRPDAGTKIWATMLVPTGPRDDAWHLHVAAEMVDAAIAAGANRIVLDPDALLRLYKAGQDTVERDRQRRQRAGEHCGEQLLILMTLDRERPELASREKAARLHARDLARFRDPALLGSESKLGTRWREYAPSVPLWAAWRRLCRAKEYSVGTPADWLLILSLAERYRLWAEQHHRPVGRSGTRRAVEEPPLLLPGIAWRPPDQVPLPDPGRYLVEGLQPGRRFAEWVTDTPA
jgi:hypothetical protein